MIKMHVLVTGGAGFIGSHVVEALLARGDTVTVVDNFSTGKMENLPKGHKNLAVHNNDVININTVMKASRPDAVVHLASPTSVQESMQNPQKYHEQITIATEKVLKWALKAGIRKVTITSSAAVYGNTENLPVKESEPTMPLSPYAKSKLEAEKLAGSYAQNHKMNTVVLRLFNVYGPGQDPNSPYSGVISKFFKAAKDNQPPTIFGNGKQTRDFVFVHDVVSAILAGVDKQTEPGITVNIGSGKETTINDLANAVIRLCNKDLKPVHEQARQGDVLRSCADITLAKKHLGFEPEFSLEEGLKKTLEWFNAHW